MEEIRLFFIAGALAFATLCGAQETTIISSQPDGTLTKYVRAGKGMALNFMGESEETEIDGYSLYVVTNGHDVWLKNPVATAPTDTWIRGTVIGDSLKFNVGQSVDYDEDEKAYYTVGVLDKKNAGYVVDSTATTFAYIVKGDSIFMDDKFNGNKVVGIIQQSDNSFFGLCEYNGRYGKFNESPITLPDGLTTKRYPITGTDGEQQEYADSVSIAKDGDKIYIQGLSQSMPEAWIEGTLQDDKAIFPSLQFLGENDEGAFVYLAGIDHTSDGFADNIIFSYNKDNDFYTQDTKYIATNLGKGDINVYDLLMGSTIGTPADAAATPAEPTIDAFEEQEGETAGSVYMKMNAEDVNGGRLDKSKLYYQLFTMDANGKQSVFSLTPEEYGTDSVMTMIPFSYSSDYVTDFFGYKVVYLMVPTSIWYKFGVQMVYTGGGVESRSTLVWRDLNRSTNGINDIKVPQTEKVPMYNLAGQKVGADYKGIVISNGKKFIK